MHGDGGIVCVEHKRKILILGLWRDQDAGAGTGIARPQHGPRAIACDLRIRHRIERPKPAPGQHRIGRRDQVARGFGKRSVEVENHRSGHAVTFRQIT